MMLLRLDRAGRCDHLASRRAWIRGYFSCDGGSTWAAPLRVNDDAAGVANNRFNQWLGVDPFDGEVNLS